MPKVEFQIVSIDADSGTYIVALRPHRSRGEGPSYKYPIATLNDPISNDALAWWGSRIGKNIFLTASDE